MDKITIQAQIRDEHNDKNIVLRQKGLVPGVVYGHAFKNLNIKVDVNILEKVFESAGYSTLVDLRVDQDVFSVLIHELQRDPVTRQPLHVDFFKVNVNEKIQAEVEIVFVGEAPAVKNFNAALVKTLDHLSILCLPQDLVSNVELDLTKLEQLGDGIKVSDLDLGDKVKIINSPETVLVIVEEPKKVVPVEEPEEAEPKDGEETEQGEKQGEGETESEKTSEKDGS